MTIADYVMSEYREQTGSLIMEQQKKQFERIVSELQGKTENQIKTLTQTILPRIALYKAAC